ncbi:MAG: DsrE family protein [Sphingobium sp.]
MRELKIIVVTAATERLRGALVMAASQAALGGKASLFLQLDAVAMLQMPIQAPLDEAHRAAGLPALAALIKDACELGVTVSACQSGLTLCGLSAENLPEGVGVSGPIAFLQGTDDAARLIVV